MGLVQLIVQIYGIHGLEKYESYTMPYLMARMEFMNIVDAVASVQQPLKAVFLNEKGDFIEFQNKSYIDYFKGKN